MEQCQLLPLTTREFDDEFFMYSYKVVPCAKRHTHEWRTCPFSHKGENAARRDPRTHTYLSVCCPESKAKESCLRGDSCPFAHSVYEYWLHPSRYRTQVCHDGQNCRRTICFFAHSPEELRAPAYARNEGRRAGQEDASAPGQLKGKQRSRQVSKTALANSFLDVAGLLDQSGGAAAAGWLMQDSAGPMVQTAASLGDADLAQIVCQQLQLQQQLSMNDLHAQVQQQLDFEELQARLALLNTSGPQLPTSSLAMQPISQGFAWDVTTTAGSLSGPVSQLPAGVLTAAPLGSMHASLPEVLLPSSTSIGMLAPTTLAPSFLVGSGLELRSFDGMAVDGASLASQALSQSCLPLPANAAALLGGKLPMNPPADHGLALQLLLGSSSLAADTLMSNQGFLSHLSEPCTNSAPEPGNVPSVTTGQQGSQGPSVMPGVKALGLESWHKDAAAAAALVTGVV